MFDKLRAAYDIIGENYDVAIRAHSDPLPKSALVQRTLTPAHWLSAYLNAREAPQTLLGRKLFEISMSASLGFRSQAEPSAIGRSHPE